MAAAILIVGVTVAFFGLAAATTRVLMRPARRPAPAAELVPAGRLAGQADPVVRLDSGRPGPAAARGEPSGWMVVPVVAGALVLLLLGVHPPAELNQLFGRAVRLLSGAGS